MSSVNLGSQKITFDYKQPAKADEFNGLLRNLIKPGFYAGGGVTNVGNDITITPFRAFFDCKGSSVLSTSIYTTESISITATDPTKPYLVMNYTWSNTVENWIDFEFKAVGDLVSSDIIITLLTFVGASVTATNELVRTYGLFDETYKIKTNLDITNPTESSSTSTGAITVSGGVGVAKNLNVGGAAKVGSITESTTKDTGALVVEGGVGIEKNINVGGNGSVGGTFGVTGVVTLSDGTDSSTKDTGAVVLEGGMGIEKNLNVGGNLGVTGNLTIGGVASGLSAYPVGTVFMSVDSTSPATRFGGTWAVFAAGRAFVGRDAADADWDTAEETRGAKTHTLSIAEMPNHDHRIDPSVNGAQEGWPAGWFFSANATYFNGYTAGLSNGVIPQGGGGAHNNIQPSIVVYAWKRTA